MIKKIALALLIVFAMPIAVSGCSSIFDRGKEVQEKLEEKPPREQLKITLNVWILTVGSVVALGQSGLIEKDSVIARKIDASMKIVQSALNKWVENPDSVTYMDLTKGAIDTLKKLVNEAKE